MDFQELKDIIQRDGGKIIIVENDKPQLVVMSFEEYKKKRSQGPPPLEATASQSRSVQKNDDLAVVQEREREELTIDDLPI